MYLKPQSHQMPHQISKKVLTIIKTSQIQTQHQQVSELIVKETAEINPTEPQVGSSNPMSPQAIIATFYRECTSFMVLLTQEGTNLQTEDAIRALQTLNDTSLFHLIFSLRSYQIGP